MHNLCEHKSVFVHLDDSDFRIFNGELLILLAGCDTCQAVLELTYKCTQVRRLDDDLEE